VTWRLPRTVGPLLLGFLAATGALAPADAGQAPLSIHIHAEKAMFQVLVSPGEVGTDSFVLQLMSGDGNLLPAKAATLTLTPPGQAAAAIERKAALGADGYWHVADVALTVPGRWHIRIDAVSVLRTISLEDDFELPGR
jgi:copper transport protein